MSTTSEVKLLLTTPEAAEYLGLQPATLEIWRCRGGGPRFCKIGRSVKYRQADLEEFINNSLRSSTSDQGGRC